MIEVSNDGPRLVYTNYWSTEHAARGLCYMTVNAGAYRLLVPTAAQGWLRDMRTAREVVITRGPWPAQGRAEATELLFDDRSEDPFVLQMEVTQWDRLPLDTDMGWHGVFAVHVPERAVPAWYCTRVFYRRGTIPCLDPAPPMA